MHPSIDEIDTLIQSGNIQDLKQNVSNFIDHYSTDMQKNAILLTIILTDITNILEKLSFIRDNINSMTSEHLIKEFSQITPVRSQNRFDFILLAIANYIKKRKYYVVPYKSNIYYTEYDIVQIIDLIPEYVCPLPTIFANIQYVHVPQPFTQDILNLIEKNKKPIVSSSVEISFKDEFEITSSSTATSPRVLSRKDIIMRDQRKIIESHSSNTEHESKQFRLYENIIALLEVMFPEWEGTHLEKTNILKCKSYTQLAITCVNLFIDLAVQYGVTNEKYNLFLYNLMTKHIRVYDGKRAIMSEILHNHKDILLNFTDMWALVKKISREYREEYVTDICIDTESIESMLNDKLSTVDFHNIDSLYNTYTEYENGRSDNYYSKIRDLYTDLVNTLEFDKFDIRRTTLIDYLTVFALCRSLQHISPENLPEIIKNDFKIVINIKNRSYINITLLNEFIHLIGLKYTCQFTINKLITAYTSSIKLCNYYEHRDIRQIFDINSNDIIKICASRDIKSGLIHFIYTNMLQNEIYSIAEFVICFTKIDIPVKIAKDITLNSNTRIFATDDKYGTIEYVREKYSCRVYTDKGTFSKLLSKEKYIELYFEGFFGTSYFDPEIHNLLSSSITDNYFKFRGTLDICIPAFNTFPQIESDTLVFETKYGLHHEQSFEYTDLGMCPICKTKSTIKHIVYCKPCNLLIIS
jgi:hypothetical protein